MTQDFVDKTLAEFADDATAQSTTETTQATEQSPATPAEAATEPKAEGEPKPERIEFPPEAKKAINRRDKENRKLYNQLQDARAQLAALQNPQNHTLPSKPTQSQSPQGAPREEDYDNYGDYLEASMMHKVSEMLKTRDEKTKQLSIQEATERHYEERSDFVAKQAEKVVAEHPELRDLVIENADIIGSLPPAIENLLLDADDPIAAFVNLAREGKLEYLASMSPYKAALEIGRAQAMGLKAQAAPKKISQAPNPIPAASGSGAGIKPLEEQSYEEMKASLNL